MDRTFVVRGLRTLLAVVAVLAAFAVPLGLLGPVLGDSPAGLLLPFATAALVTAAAGTVLPRLDRWLRRWNPQLPGSPYSALATAAARVRAGSLAEALPGLVQVVADGTGARHAALWLVVGDRLVAAAAHPPAGTDEPVTEPGLAALLARPDTDHVVPVLDGDALRAALAIGKDPLPVTAADRQLLRDVANGAGALLRELARGTELEERVRRADELADEVQRSRERLNRARDVERRRLVAELGHATTGRLAALRDELGRARSGLTGDGPATGEVPETLRRVRELLDELLDRVRVIARGVHPAVLRDQGPAAALEELVADLPRRVLLDAEPDRRFDWEIESGLYWLVASAVQHLATGDGGPDLRVLLRHERGRLLARVEDPDPRSGAERLREALAVDVERLAALGGELRLDPRDGGGVLLRARLPDRLDPLGVPPAVTSDQTSDQTSDWAPDRVSGQASDQTSDQVSGWPPDRVSGQASDRVSGRGTPW